MGYSGGRTPRPTYHSIGDHTETVEVEFDPSRISYHQLVEAYARITNLDVSSSSRQYRNAVFYRNPAQKEAAQEVLGRAAVSVEPFQSFTQAEDYHQKYYLQNSEMMGELGGRLADFPHFVDSTAAARINGYLGGHGQADQVRENLPKLGLSPAFQEKLLSRCSLPSGGCRRR